jgi:hypothetical protein
MQHGTGRERVTDIVENVEAVLEGYANRNADGPKFLDLRRALQEAREVLDGVENLDEPGVCGPDYGAPRVTKVERDEAFDRYAEWVGKGRPEGGF